MKAGKYDYRLCLKPVDIMGLGVRVKKEFFLQEFSDPLLCRDTL